MPVDRKDVLPHRIAVLAEEQQGEPAMRDVAGRVATWRDVHESSLRWAAAYRRLGVGEGERVVTMLPNSFEAYFAWIGAAWLRAIEVPANNMYRGATLRYLLENAEARVLVISQRFVDRLAALGDIAGLETVVVPDADGDLPELSVPVIPGASFLDGVELLNADGPDYWDTAVMIYTSGTTGPSKGVLVPWGELYQLPMALPTGFLGPGASLYTFFPPSHMSGKWAFYCAAQSAASLVIRESWSVSEFWNDIRAFGVRSAMLAGPMAAMLMAVPGKPDDTDHPLEHVMMAPLLPNLRDFNERFGIQHVFTGFASTEIGFPICSPFNPADVNSCGKRREGPPWYEVRIVDDHDEPVPLGTVGEAVVRARDPWVMNTGYWKMPEKTAEAWRNGWFHTGDLFVEDEDGWLSFVDRAKDALRRRGENISSFEVEAGIAEHPAVAECAVIGVASELGEEEVKAVIVRKPGHELTPRDLIDFLATRMPRFMIPRFIEFVAMLPRTEGTLRVRKVELRERPLNDNTWDREAAGVELPLR